MLTLFGALLGFMTSIFPEILKFCRQTKECTHELNIMDRQIELTKLGHSQRLEEIQIQSDMLGDIARYNHARPTNIKWVDALAGTVRPVITYAFFALYGAVKIAQWSLLADHFSGFEALFRLWSDEDAALFAAVMSFWFGQRALRRRG
jgi:hypothetical protein